MTTNDKHPSVIVGRIRERAEMIVRRERIGNLEDAAIADQFDAGRICELLDLLQSAMLEQQMTASIAMVKK